MNKRELNKIFKLIINEELSTAKDNIRRLLEDETNKHKEEMLKNVSDKEETIKADDNYSILEKEMDVSSVAASSAMDSVEDGDFNIPSDETPSPELASDMEQKDVNPNSVNYEFTDLEKDLQRLKSKFEEIMKEKDAPVSEESLGYDLTDEDKDGELGESLELKNLIGLDLVSEIMEEYVGSKVSPIKNEDGLGATGEKIPQQDKSPLSFKNNTTIETEAAPIEIDNEHHNGYGLEDAPDIKLVDFDTVSHPEFKEVPSDGDKDALINRTYNTDDSESPIPGNKE